jgi:hypothetical protein
MDLASKVKLGKAGIKANPTRWGEVKLDTADFDEIKEATKDLQGSDKTKMAIKLLTAKKKERFEELQYLERIAGSTTSLGLTGSRKELMGFAKSAMASDKERKEKEKREQEAEDRHIDWVMSLGTRY